MRALALLAATGCFLGAESARALEPCPTANADHVRLVVSTQEPDANCPMAAIPKNERIAQLIAADLGTEHIDVCTQPPTVPRLPLATISISGHCASSRIVTIAVSDAVTEKDLSRQISLTGLPEDTHAMAIAASAVELLRASWAENRRKAAERPLPVTTEEKAPGPERTRPRTSTTLGVAAEAFSRGLRQVGMDVELAWAPHATFDVLLRIGGRRSTTVVSAHGRAYSDAWLAGLGASYRFLHSGDAVELRLIGRTDAAWLDFSSDAKKDALATEQGAVTVWSGAGLVSSLRLLDDAWLTTEALGGWVLLPVVATDADRVVFGAQGGYVAGRIGVRVHF